MSLSRSWIALCLITIAHLLMPAIANAQYTVGRVQGNIVDASGAVISGATVTLRNLRTNDTRVFTTRHDGLYVFFALPPGTYSLGAQASGFAGTTLEIQVHASETSTHNLKLSVPQKATTLEVVAGGTGELDASDSQRNTTRTEVEIAKLPSIGRNMISLVELAPGVQPTNNPRGGSTFGGGGTYVVVLGVQSGLIAANGGRARATSVQLDYTDANDWEAGGFAPGMQAITPDMLQEFKLLTSNFSAEYGAKSNAQVLMITKSGTNEWHGTAYDFVQNEIFNARDYFDVTGEPSPIKQNIYGFAMGGPAAKDRTFLFGGYEGRKTRGAGFTTLASVPSEAARARATSPTSIELMNQFLPLPTSPGTNPDIGTVSVQIPSPVDTYQFMLKADHRMGRAHNASIRYLQSTASFVARFPAQNSLRGFDVDNHFELRNVNLSDTYSHGSRTVNEVRLGYGFTSAQGRPQNRLSSPRYLITGLVNFGALQSVPAGRDFSVYQANDVLSHVRGSHVVKLGADVSVIRDTSLNATNSRGVFTFASLNDFLAGNPSLWTQLFGNTSRSFRTGLYSVFFQDDWKVRPTLMFNVGMRWEMQGALQEAHGQSSILDPRLPGNVGVAGSGALGSFRIGETAVNSNPFNFSPRIGFAWNPQGGDFVLRGGYGLYWDSFTFGPLNASRSAPPLNYTVTLTTAQMSPPNSFAEIVSRTSPILGATANRIGSFGQLVNFGDITTVDPQLRNPYVQHFSLGAEYRLAHSYVFDLAYVGTKGTHLTRLRPINPLVGGPKPATSPQDELARLPEFRTALAAENGVGNSRLDPRFNQVNFHDSEGSSIYHSLQAEVRKSFSHGLQFQASYTWSKSIDDASDFNPAIQANDSSFAQNAFNLAAERAVSNYDIAHRVIVTGIWQIPFFQKAEGLAGIVLKGWSFQSVNSWQSALPATLLSGPRLGIADVNLDGNFIPGASDNTRANCGPGARFGLGDPANTSGFSQPLLGNDGTCRRNSIRMRSLTNFDWSLFKDAVLAERGPLGSGPWNVQFRAEFYNVFNTPFLTAQGDAWRTVGSPSFGAVTSAGIARKVQLALKLIW